MTTNSFASLSDMRAALKAKENEFIAENDRHERELVGKFSEEVREKFGPALDELSPVFSYDSYDRRPVMTLTYKESKCVYGHITPGKLAEWMDRVDAEAVKNEQYRQSKRAQVLSRMAHEPTSDFDWWTNEIAIYNMGEFQDVLLALAAYKVKVEALRQKKEQENREREADNLAEWTRAIQITRETNDRYRWQGLNNWMDSNMYSSPTSEIYNELYEALAMADERIKQIEAEQEQKRAEAEAVRFFPFRWYSILYGIVASDGGETYVEKDEFRSLLADSDPEGWWHGVNGQMIRFDHLIKVVRHECRGVEDLPDWCPSENTEFGRIRVPPVNAERIQEEA